ncbi:MAG: hypothetical protein HYV09_01835 [Deltaproteobacteria bacterium]|nr:hypothetical protein [Deltaproteobacteria bacterium]
MDRGKLDWVRPGALAAGIATLIGLVAQGVERAGYVGNIGLFAMSAAAGAVVGVVLAVPLGFREPMPAVLGRVVATTVSGLLLGGLEIGFAYLLVVGRVLRERQLPPVFAILGLALVAWGLRRLPSRRPLRVGLIAIGASLVLFRAVLAIPGARQRVERALFPLPDAVVKKQWERMWCRGRCDVAKVVDFDWQVTYPPSGDRLFADVRARATLETTKPHVVDGCGDVHATAPKVPASIEKYKTTKECFAAHPLRPVPFTIAPMMMPAYECCWIEQAPRKPGDRFETAPRGMFIFHRLQWEPTDFTEF